MAALLPVHLRNGRIESVSVDLQQYLKVVTEQVVQRPEQEAAVPVRARRLHRSAVQEDNVLPRADTNLLWVRENHVQYCLQQS
jgi:hypothetical protein